MILPDKSKDNLNESTFPSPEKFRSSFMQIETISMSMDESQPVNSLVLKEEDLENTSYEDLIRRYNEIQEQLKLLDTVEEKQTENNVQSINNCGDLCPQVKEVEINRDHEGGDTLVQVDSGVIDGISPNCLEEGEIRSDEDMELSTPRSESPLFHPIAIAEDLEKAMRDRLLNKLQGFDSLESFRTSRFSPNLTSSRTTNHLSSPQLYNERVMVQPNYTSLNNNVTLPLLPKPSTSRVLLQTMPSIPSKPSKDKFVIYFGDDSSSSEDENRNPHQLNGSNRLLPSTSNSSSEIPGLDSLLKEARQKASFTLPNNSQTKNSAISRSSGNQIPVIVNRVSLPPVKSSQPLERFLSDSQKAEYRKLKEEIAKREKKTTLLSKEMLQEAENKWKKIRASIHNKKIQLNTLDMKLNTKRVALRKAQTRTKRLLELYTQAKQKSEKMSQEVQSLMEESDKVKFSLSAEEMSAHVMAKECIDFGSKFQGQSYRLPQTLPVSVGIIKKKSLKVSKKSILSSKKVEESPFEKKRRLMEMRKVVNHKLVALTKQKVKVAIKRVKEAPAKKISDKENVELKDLERIYKCKEALMKSVDSFLRKPSLIVKSTPIYYSTSFLSFISKPSKIRASLDLEELTYSIHDIRKNCSSKTANSCSLITSNQDAEDSGSVLMHSRKQYLSPLTKESSLPHETISRDSSASAKSIDAFLPLCQFDLLGTCNDTDCKYQHWSSPSLDEASRLFQRLKLDSILLNFNGDLNDLKTEDDLKNIVGSQSDSTETISSQVLTKLLHLMRSYLLTKRAPSSLKSIAQPTCEDFCYKIKLRDRRFVLTLSKVFKMKASVDPDLHIKCRFYAPEEKPISTELETALAQNPRQAKLWIDLAFYHLSRNPSRKADCVNRALNVLSRALEQNQAKISTPRSSKWSLIAELWENFLHLYANRVSLPDEDQSYNLQNICRLAVKHCSHYRVWLRYLNLCIKYNEKLDVCDQFLQAILSKTVITGSYEQTSHLILQVVLHKVALLLDSGRPGKALATLREWLLDKVISTVEEFKSPFQVYQSVSKPKVDDDLSTEASRLGAKLVVNDKVYAWLCYIHLMHLNTLPFDVFKSYSQGSCELGDKKPFLIKWDEQIIREKLREILMVFHSSLIACRGLMKKKPNSMLKRCWAIVANLSVLGSLMGEGTQIFDKLLKRYPDVPNIWFLAANSEALSSNHLLAIAMLKHSQGYKQKNIEFIVSVIILSYELMDHDATLDEIVRLVSNYYVCPINRNNLRQAFDVLMTDDHSVHESLKDHLKSKIIDRSHLLWLCYLYFQLVQPSDEITTESQFHMAIDLCKINLPIGQEHLLNPLWCLYIKYCVQHQSSNNYQAFIDSVKRFKKCCSSSPDDFFQLEMIHYFTGFFGSSLQKFHLMIDFVRFLPENVLLLSETIALGLELNEREMCHDLVKDVLVAKRYEKITPDLWKNIIRLSIYCEDHLNTHRFFQMALSSCPYNCDLWKMMLAYESGVNHNEHFENTRKLLIDLNLPLQRKGNVSNSKPN
ncbi:uncharacterized protein LOC141856777 isoform X2 [Brevipalpus obovatus]|uniref:uncharacterized protein LOC141856777 isoform X2 n=1 Tax=Brevipalpus obovatus TaxID=246614 RepID=UPI003D9E12BF